MLVEPVILEGVHTRLEPLSMSHLPALCEVGLDPELWRWTNSAVTDEAGMRVYVESALRNRDAKLELPFATIDRASGRLAGCTRYMNIDAAHRRVEIGSTWIAQPWQRTPINTEAKYLMLRHAFETLGCIRVELKTDALNEKSRTAILRIGAQHEGIFRHHMITHTGRFRDTAWFAIIDVDWPRIKVDLEQKLTRR